MAGNSATVRVVALVPNLQAYYGEEDRLKQREEKSVRLADLHQYVTSGW